MPDRSVSELFGCKHFHVDVQGPADDAVRSLTRHLNRILLKDFGFAQKCRASYKCDRVTMSRLLPEFVKEVQVFRWLQSSNNLATKGHPSLQYAFGLP